jgi:hypothetical protein
MWEPLTVEEIGEALAQGMSELNSSHLKIFQSIRVSLRKAPVASSPGEFVYVVAEYQGKVLYYSDIEEGWELECPNADGGIEMRGCNQFELTHVMHQTFGAPNE